MGKVHEFLVTLKRNSPTEQWGFSLVGGADVKTPLIVTRNWKWYNNKPILKPQRIFSEHFDEFRNSEIIRNTKIHIDLFLAPERNECTVKLSSKPKLTLFRVGFGSPADGVLQRGDIITKVGNYDSRDIRHQDAQNLFKNSGNSVRVVVQRDTSLKHPTSTGSSRASSHNYSPLSVSPHLSPRGPSSTYSPGGSALTPYYSSPLPSIDDNYFDVLDYTPGSHRRTEDGEVHVTKQPYRTTPLVLPGAKVKKESGHNESYLRHHPNPAVRAAPHHLDGDLLLRHKVANSVLDRLSTGDPNKQIVHKQFNSPLPLYSEPNVVDTIRKQTGVTPIKKSVKFNPAESETYKAIQEEQLGQEVHELKPAPTKVYTPQAKKSNSVNQHPVYTNSIGQDDIIHQSGSFRRLMLSVLPETSY